MGVHWETDDKRALGVEEFLADSGFVDNKSTFNPETGEVSYQSIGEEVI